MNDGSTLLILTPGFPSSEADSTCLPMQQRFIKVLKQTYPKINLVIVSFQYPFFKKKYYWSGIPVICFNGANKGGIARLFLWFTILKALRNLHLKNKISGVISFWYGECALVGNRFAKKYNIPHFCWLLGQDAKKDNKYVKRVRLKEEEMIALSDSLQQRFKANHKLTPKHVIPPGIEQQKGLRPGDQREIDILGVGSLIPLKNYQLFVETIRELKKKIPGINTLIIGEGPERRNLESLIEISGLKRNCELAGELPHTQVLEMMKKSKVLLHTSHYEGFSGVCQEAIACGAHVISFQQPMKEQQFQWHIVKDISEMINETTRVLEDTSSNFLPVNPYTMENTVHKMLALFPD